MKNLNICHIISGDLWAGVESQLAALISHWNSLPNDSLTVVLLNNGPLRDALLERDVKVHLIDESQLPFFSLKGESIISHFSSFLAENNFDVIHSHRYKENILAALCNKNTSCKLVQSIHGNEEPFAGWRGLKMNIYRRLNRYFTRRKFSAVICVSDEIKSRLKNVYHDLSIRTVRNAIDPNRITREKSLLRTREEIGIGTDDFVVIFAGRLSPVKNVSGMLAAANIAIEKLDNFHLLIAGDGELREKLLELSNNLGISSKVHFLGFRDDIYDLIAASDVFSLSSRSEGIPMVILEAMHLGTPCVTTAVGGIPEIFDSKNCGLMVPVSNPHKLAEAWLEIAADKSLAETIVENAKARVVEEFEVSSQASKIRTIYNSIAK